MFCDNFADYLQILGNIYDFEITVSDKFLGDNYLRAIWYPKNTTLITIKKEYQGHTYLFKVVSMGDKTINGKINGETFQFANNNIDKLRNKYNLNDSSISNLELVSDEIVLAYTTKKGDFLKFDVGNTLKLLMAGDNNAFEPVDMEYFSLKEIFVPFNSFYFTAMRYILYNNKFLRPSFLAENTFGSPIPNRKQYSENMEILFNALTYSCGQNDVKLELSADFLGFEYQNSLWYLPQTELANITYENCGKKYAITISVDDVSQAVGHLSGEYIQFTTYEEEYEATRSETIEDLRLFYGFCDRDVIESLCSPDIDNTFAFVEPSKLVVNYYEEGQKVKTEKIGITDLFEAILNIYLQIFSNWR